MTLILNNAVQAALIRKRRKELGWKQESLIKNLPISLSYFSEIERGYRTIPQDILETINYKLRLPELDSDWYETKKTIFNDVKLSIYFCNHSKTDLLYQEITKDKDLLTNSLLFLEFEMINLIYNVTYSKPLNTQTLKLLEEYSNCLTLENKYIYTLYLGIFQKNIHNPDIAMKHFQELLDLPYRIRYFSEILYYHTSICLIQKGHLTLAQSLNKDAQNLFISEHNIPRLSYTMMHEAIVYTLGNHFETAEKIYDRLLAESYNLNHRLLNTILCNAGINSIKAKHYQKAINYYKSLKPGWEQIPEIFYGISLALLQMEDNEGLDRFIEFSKGYPKNKFIDDVITIIDLQRKPEYTRELEAKLKACEKYLQCQGDAEGMIFVYEQLIQYYETRSIVKQVKYLKKLNELDKRGMQYDQ